MKILKHEVNAWNRAKYIKVNDALLKAGVILGNRYPDPREYEVLHPNHVKLVGILEKYIGFEGNGRIKKIIMAAMRILINKVEHCPNYRDRFSWFVEELIACNWKPRSLNHPEHDWKEAKPYGVKRW